MMTSTPLIDRLLAKTKVMPNGCWEWQGSLKGKGYGSIRLNGRMQQTHRVAYKLFNHSDPLDKIICHKCNNTLCLNPQHLYAGTYSDNTKQAVAEGRQFIAKGTSHSQCKLTEDEVLQIRKDPRAQRAIAKDFNISQLHVSRIKRKLIWRDL